MCSTRSHYDERGRGETPEELLRSWRAERAGKGHGVATRATCNTSGSRISAARSEEQAAERAILVCPGDFVSIDEPIAEIWPANAAEQCRGAVLDAVIVASERDLNQDVDFGLRQLADTAIKAMSPGINDPMTAVTCVGYLRSILVRLTARAEPVR